MKTTIYSLLAAAILAACGSSSSEKASNESNETAPVTSIEEQPTDALGDYMILKNAFVQSNAAVAQTAAADLSKSLMTENMDAKLIQAANMIASSDDLKIQRAAFKTLTTGMITALKANETTEGVYVQYCPMAFNNEGGTWLSTSEEIKNPYFGDMMLNCGRVTEKL